MLSNYPPGVTGNESIFGTHDYTISYTIEFLHTDTLEDDETMLDIPRIINDAYGLSMSMDETTLKIDGDTFNVFISYSDDLTTELCMDDDIDELIVQNFNEQSFIELKVNVPEVSISYNIHR